MAENDSEHHYRVLFDSVDDGFCTIEVLFDDDGRVRDCRFLLTNPAFERQTGLLRVAGRTMRELAPSHEGWFDIYGKVALTGEPARFEHQGDAPGGRWHEVHVFRIGAAEERQVAIIFRDIEDRKQAEATVRASEAQYRALFDCIDEGACIIEQLPVRPDGRRDYRYIAMNKAMQAMFGIADLSGRAIREFFPDEVEDWYDDYDRVLATGEPIRFERESEPQQMVLEMFVSRLSQKPPRLLAVMQDITERRRAEEAMRRSEERMRALINATSDAVYRMSADWQEMRQLDGRGSDVEGPTVRWMEDYLFPEDRARIRAAVAHAIRERRPFELEHRVRRVDGKEGWTFARAIPIFDAKGEIAEWFGMATDVTERVNARERQQMLNHELGHRLKNVLSLVQSIANQTFRQADNLTEAAETYSARLISLGRATDILTETAWADAGLHSLVQAGLTSVGDFSERIRISGPDLDLAPQQALMLTLTLHELATNSLKYGALSNGAGVVDLSWGIGSDPEGEPQFTFGWRESGGPEISAPSREGFGARMIGRLLPASFQGKAELRYEAAGFEFRLEAPLGEVIKVRG
ncbi:PAS domain S-box-containing protein [Rhizobium sp. BK196]|uniref:PAS domain-containing protein n=1 Tax=Rhizobium sp. BK196 TaxID=2587073 RepID=UPI0016211B4B|nr:PAS domain-containing protein [Rhizobium sp. BK196]MBB3308717.1 PAS domain S-box-containing protein [Rhizobium sp. BK196]